MIITQKPHCPPACRQAGRTSPLEKGRNTINNLIIKRIAPIEALTQRPNMKYLDDLREICRRNRNNPTESEYKMWRMVLCGHKIREKFLRQKPIGNYILDFYCSKLMLAIEIDGDSHKDKYYQDKNRDEYLLIRGIKTIRYSNDQVLNRIDEVFKDLISKIKLRESELVFSPFSRENAREKRGKRV